MSNRNTRRRILAMAGLAAGVLAATNVVCAQLPCGYDVTIIQAPETPPFGFPPTIGFGVNELVHVCGYWTVLGPDEHAFVWTPETGLVTLDMPPGTSASTASEIDGNQIVGAFDGSGDGFGTLGFLYNYDTCEFIEIPPPAGTFSNAGAVSLGRVIGTTSVTNRPPFYSKAFLWQEGRMTIIEPTYGPRSSGGELNEASVVVGWMGPTVDSDAHAFLWANSEVSDLGVVPGGYTGVGTSINNLGQITIAGKLVNPDGGLWLKKGFLWSEDRWTDLGALPGYDRTNPSSINDATVIVGTCGKASNPSDARPFIWRDGVIRDLNDLIPPDTGIYLSSARAINQAGQITGNAIVNVDVVAYLLTPLPPPIGDLDGDCAVAILDLLELLASWGPCGTCEADLDRDGIVGVFDLLTLLANWG